MRDLTIGDRPPNLRDVVFETIRRAIIERVLAPGEALTEPALAERLSVSKTPVREALLRLREMGLIEQSGPRSLRVIQPSPEAVRHAYEIREALEGFTAARAAQAADKQASSAIAMAARMSLEAAKIGDITSFRDNDREFHRLIAGLGQNPRIATLIDDAGAVISTLLRREMAPGQGPVECAEGHVRIADAIAAGDSDAAAREMTAHIRRVWQLARGRLAEPDTAV